MTLYYVRAFDTVVHGPFESDEEMMSYHRKNFENGDLLSIHENKEGAEKEAHQNMLEIIESDSQLEDISSNYFA